MSNYRIEEDLLGTLEVPADSYWGIHTERARKNFSISGYKVNPSLHRKYILHKCPVLTQCFEDSNLSSQRIRLNSITYLVLVNILILLKVESFSILI